MYTSTILKWAKAMAKLNLHYLLLVEKSCQASESKSPVSILKFSDSNTTKWATKLVNLG